MTDAIVLAGAGAKGAFEAGALSMLLGCGGIRPVRVVGTSSGGLNAAYVSAFPDRPEGLVELWRERAGALGVFRPARSFRGLSDLRRIRALVEATLPPDGSGIDLRIVATELAGVDGDLDANDRRGEPATTFERVFAFDRPNYGSVRTRCAIVEAAVASSALPLLFEPAGSLVDGGLVNATPIKYALEGNDVDRVFVITPTPRVFPCVRGACDSAPGLHRVLEAIFHERLYRDLREAREVNAQLQAVDRFDASSAILAALGWLGRRQVRIVEIRPHQELTGNLVSGFFRRGLRETYIEAGVEATKEALEALAA